MRLTTWIAGFALGGAVACGAGIADRLRLDFALPFEVYVMLAASIMFSVVGLEWAGQSGAGILTWALDLSDRWQPPPAPVTVTPTPPAPEPDDAEDRAWRTALERFFRAGDMADGFSINKLAGVVGSQSWGKLTDFYCQPQADPTTGKVIGPVLRDAGSNIGTCWNHAWGLDGVMQLIALGRLPHPDMLVPDVELYVRHATQHNAQRKGRTQAAKVVDVPPSREVA